MKKTILTLCACVGLSAQSHAFTARIETGQYAALLQQNIQQVFSAIDQVENQITQIGQLTDQINIDEITNDILGDYGLGNIADIESVIDSYESIGDIEDITSIVSDIEIDDIFSNTSGGIFAAIEAPDEVDNDKYQNHAAVESAFQNAVESQQRLKTENIALADTAKEQREAAAAAPNEAEYQEHIDKAVAAETAIDRNNQQMKTEIQQVAALQAAAENHEEKNAKASLDNGVEEELSILEADLQDRIANPLPIN